MVNQGGELTMKKHWLKLAGELLELASKKFANHGCNDWKWPTAWTVNQRWEFAREMAIANVKGRELTEEDQRDIAEFCREEFGPPDWWVMTFLATKLQGK